MAETINCNFGRTVVRAIAQNLYVQKGCMKTFPPKAMAQLMQEYQSIFNDTPSMQLSTTALTVIKLLATFNSHWHLQEKKNDFMKTFSIAEWKKLGHTIKQCQHSINYLLQHFLTKKPVRRKQPSSLHLMTPHITCFNWMGSH